MVLDWIEMKESALVWHNQEVLQGVSKCMIVKNAIETMHIKGHRHILFYVKAMTDPMSTRSRL